MCQFKSAIILKERIYCPLNKDSHSDMLEDLGIKDDSCFPNFVRIANKDFIIEEFKKS